MNKLTVKEKMLSVLYKTEGYNTFTVAQARSRFGIKNVAARISELRQEGHSIFTNTRKLEDGRTIQYYKIGKPSKKVVAAGYKALREQGKKTFV